MNSPLKRIFSLILIFVTILSLSACKQKTPLERYTEAGELLSATEALHADYSLTLDLSVDNVNLSIPAEGTVTVYAPGDDILDAEFACDLSTGVMGVDVDCSIYMKDGILYVPLTVDGVTVKYKLPLPEDAITLETTDSETSQPLTEDMLLSQSEEDNVYTLVFDCEKIIATAMQSMDEQSLAILSETDFSLRDLSISFTTDKSGIFETFDLSCGLDLTMDGSHASCDMVLELDYTSFDQVGPIDFPDFSQYEELEL